MGFTATLSTTGLDAFIAKLPVAVTNELAETASVIQTEWAGDIEARETGEDFPVGRRDYDENIFVEQTSGTSATVWTDIDWAETQEYGSPDGRTQARPSATQAAERARERRVQTLRGELEI